jgi:hypothetical protein
VDNEEMDNELSKLSNNKVLDIDKNINISDVTVLIE